MMHKPSMAAADSINRRKGEGAPPTSEGKLVKFVEQGATRIGLSNTTGLLLNMNLTVNKGNKMEKKSSGE